MHSKTRRKKTFLLIEVLIAIALVSITCYASFEVLSGIAKKNRIEFLEQEKALVQHKAICLLFEELYTNKIPLDVISNSKQYTLNLDLKTWDAVVSFTKNPDGHTEGLTIPDSVYDIIATLKISLKQDTTLSHESTFMICIQKEILRSSL